MSTNIIQGVVVFGIIVVGFAVLLTTTFSIDSTYVKNSSERRKAQRQLAYLKRTFPHVSEEFYELYAPYYKTYKKYEKLYSRGWSKNSRENTMFQQLKKVEEKFSALSKMWSEKENSYHEIVYANAFSKLNNLIGEDYYLDMVFHPVNWLDEKSKMADVENAVQLFLKSIEEEAQILNESKTIERQSDLEYFGLEKPANIAGKQSSSINFLFGDSLQNKQIKKIDRLLVSDVMNLPAESRRKQIS